MVGNTMSEQLAAALGDQSLENALGLPEKPQPEAERPTGAPAPAREVEGEPEDEGVELADELDEADGETQEDAEDAPIRTIAELAEANGWDPADLYALEIAMPGGQEPISIGQIKDEIVQSRQREAAYQQQLQQQHEALTYYQQQAEQLVTGDHALQEIGGKIETLRAYLNSDSMREMRERDPGQAASKYQEVQQAIEQLAAQGQQYMVQKQQYEQQREQQALQTMVQYINQNIPEWRDPAVVNKEKDQVLKVFSDYGYSADEIRALRDPRALHIARDLMRIVGLSNAGKNAGEAVRQTPRRSLRAGKMAGAKGKRVQRLAEVAKSTGRQNDVTAAAKAILFGG